MHLVKIVRTVNADCKLQTTAETECLEQIAARATSRHETKHETRLEESSAIKERRIASLVCKAGSWNKGVERTT